MKKYFYYLLFIIIFITPLFGDMAYDINKIRQTGIRKIYKKQSNC
jgi:hypothetical protein